MCWESQFKHTASTLSCLDLLIDDRRILFPLTSLRKLKHFDMIPLSLLSPPLRWANTHHTRWRHCSPTSHFGGPSVSPFLPSSLPTLQWGKAAQSIYFHTLVQSDTSQTLEILGAQHHPKAILPGVCAWDTCGVNPSGWAPFTTAVEECAGVWETCMGVHLRHVQVRGRRPWAGHLTHRIHKGVSASRDFAGTKVSIWTSTWACSSMLPRSSLPGPQWEPALLRWRKLSWTGLDLSLDEFWWQPLMQFWLLFIRFPLPHSVSIISRLSPKLCKRWVNSWRLRVL